MAPEQMIHGRELVVDEDLVTDAVYGYACPQHGLRYYRRGEGGRLERAALEDMLQLRPGYPVCPRCLSPLGAALPAGDVCGEILVPAAARSELARVALEVSYAPAEDAVAGDDGV